MTNSSPLPYFSLASTISTARSRSDSACRTKFIICSFKRESGLWTPGVSMKITWASGRCKIPRMRLRVVWGTGVTIETLDSTSAFTSVLLPALGRPTMATNPDLNEVFSSMNGIGGKRLGRHHHSHLQNRPLICLQDFECQAVTFHLFSRGGHVTQLIHHQPRHGRKIVALQGNVHLIGDLGQIRVSGKNVARGRLLD